jgi:predicted permease
MPGGADERPRWRRLLFPVARSRSQLRADIDDELRFHLEMRARDLIARGAPPGDARAEALRTFGDVSDVRAACLTIDTRRQRRVQRTEVVRFMWQDIGFAARGLRKSPGFAAAAIACTALGIGVTTTIFSAVESILIRPLPYPDADRLVAIYAQLAKKNLHGVNISYPDYVSWRDESHSFSAVGMWTWTTHALSGACERAGGCEAERVEGAAVTPNLFPSLGVKPLLGRSFLSTEDRAGTNHVILLSFGVWQQRFAGDPAIVGKTTTVDGVPYTVVGIMPPRFNFPDRGTVWVPFTPERNEGRGNRGYAGAIARLAPGVTLAQAKADLATLSARLEREFVDDNFGWSAEVIPLREDLTGDLRRPLLIFLGAVGLVLLISCANIANLLLARGAARSREIAVRVALGAGRARIARQVLTESALLAAIGCVAGVALATLGVGLLRFAFPDNVPFYITLGLDGTAVGFAVALAAATSLLVGCIPAVRAGEVEPATSLREGSRGSGGLARSRLRSALVVVEMALSVILMVGAMLLIRSYRALVDTQLGFDEHVLTVRVSLPEAKYPQRMSRLTFYQELLTRIQALPGVDAAGSAQGTPFSGWDVQGAMTIEGRPAPQRGEELVVHFQAVSPDYFKAIGVPLVRGRWLTTSDRDTAAPVALINERLAAREFAGADPIGKRMKIGDASSPDPWMTVVGIIGDFRHYRLPNPMGPAIYYPYASRPSFSQTLAIRTRQKNPLALATPVRAILRQLDPDVPAYRVQTLEQVVSRSLWRQRLQGQVLGAFAMFALLLAAVGIYGVIAYAVAQRTRELGVRVALGATRAQLLGLVLAQGLRLTIIGVIAGVAGALALSRVVASLLYDVGSKDPLTYIVVPVTLAAIALLATYIPARRATQVDPLTAMRAE